MAHTTRYGNSYSDEEWKGVQAHYQELYDDAVAGLEDYEAQVEAVISKFSASMSVPAAKLREIGNKWLEGHEFTQAQFSSPKMYNDVMAFLAEYKKVA
jgi:hypothetical protein